jgi:DNA topoisomerase-1
MDASPRNTESEPSPPATETRSSATRRLARKLGLRFTQPGDLTLYRQKAGTAFSYRQASGEVIKDAATLQRLKSLAMPPAYEDVRYAADGDAHLQAVGRDAAGRLQYRYHPEWQKVREQRKARRLSRLVDALPRVRRAVGRILASEKPTREFALAAVIELIARTAIRPGSESYARVRGTRGAATLLKSNVAIEDECIVLSFRGKGGKQVRKECDAARLIAAVKVLLKLPGRRLFQYRGDDGSIHAVTAPQVNEFLRQIAQTKISLKDLRTLLASAAVIESLARVTPAESVRARKKQVLDAVKLAAEELANTPAICRKSYVHDAVVTAFEKGLLERFASTLKSCRSPARREQVLAQVIATAV